MRWIIRLVGTLILIPLVTIIYWYFSSYYPQLTRLKEIVSNEEKIISGVSDIYKLTVQIEGLEGIRNNATRNAYRELVFEKESKTTIEWHLNTTLWYFSSYLNFDEKEIFYLWSSSVYCGERGLRKSSLLHFGKELYNLDLRQKAELVAMAKAPSRFKLGSVALKNRVDKILAEFNF